MTPDRNAEPIPKATVRALVESGRSISGRIGMSFASTVSRVIEVPVTHSSGYPLTLPAVHGRDLVLPARVQLALGRLDPRHARVHQDAVRREGDDEHDRGRAAETVRW